MCFICRKGKNDFKMWLSYCNLVLIDWSLTMAFNPTHRCVKCSCLQDTSTGEILRASAAVPLCNDDKNGIAIFEKKSELRSLKKP